MGVLEFITSLVGSLVWPLLVLALVLIMKKPLKSLFNSDRPMTSFEAGPSGVKIQYALDQAETALEQNQGMRPVLPPAEPTQPRVSAEPTAPLWTISPAAAVLERFARLEQGLRKTMTNHPDNRSRSRGPESVGRLIRRAVTLGVLTEAEANAFHELAVIRNLVAHGEADEVNEGAAQRFTEIAEDLTIALAPWSVGDEDPPDGVT